MPHGSTHAVSAHAHQQQHTFPSAAFARAIVTSAFAAAVMLLSAWPSFGAAITTTGAVTVISTPPSVIVGAVESDLHAVFFAERTGVALPSAVRVNLAAPGVYDDRSDLPPVTPVIPVGTSVNSYLLHADPLTSGIRYSGSITFDAVILGIIVGGELLEASDPVIGGVSTIYPDDAFFSGRGLALNGQDLISVSNDRLTVAFQFTTRRLIDQFRIITQAEPAAVPEPWLAGLLTTCGIVRAAWRLRDRSRA